jgi:hypothetical protein
VATIGEGPDVIAYPSRTDLTSEPAVERRSYPPLTGHDRRSAARRTPPMDVCDLRARYRTALQSALDKAALSSSTSAP